MVLRYGLPPPLAENGPSTDDADLIVASIPTGPRKVLALAASKAFANADRKNLDGLASVDLKRTQVLMMTG